MQPAVATVVAPLTPAASDGQLRARARRSYNRQEALRAPLAGRTLDSTPSSALTSEERRERMARSARAFEGL